MTYSVRQIAERFGVSDRTVLLWIRNSELRATNCSRSLASKKPRYRISETALQDFETLRQAPSAPSRKHRKRKPADIIEFY